MSRSARLPHLLLCSALALGPSLLPACGGASQDSVTARSASDMTAEQIDADPIALLPASPIAVTNVDARAFYASGTLGPQIGRLTERLIPIGEEAGFRASRDVDRVLVGSYSMQGVDVAAVVVGRFDEKKIAELARKHTASSGAGGAGGAGGAVGQPQGAGGQLVESTYAGRTIFTLNNVGICVLTARTVLAGTETGIRRALDRIKEGRAKRAIPDWMLATLETPGAATALAADLSTQNLANVSAGALKLDWLRGLQKVRILGNFKEPGMEVSGNLTYDTPEGAQTGARGIESANRLANVLAVTGLVPRIQNLDIQVASASVQWKFGVDDQALRNLLGAVEKYAF
ncbi:hypothetical protein [Pendulispora albinea]|uniref:Uncharacterized protein n=1 Tax=Pendulispora albinea TaxID=2741071 RepID=A0ABZ2M977_9BACT